jgi:hypothetical protein
MRFPLAEADILALSQSIAGGLTNHSEAFPQPPAAPDVLETAMATFKSRSFAAIEAQAAAQEATATKREALEELVTLMKSDLRYAEMITRRDDILLQFLGWSGPRAKKPQPAPGQPGILTIGEIGAAALTLRWIAPPTGGRVLAYGVHRRPCAETVWQEIATALEPAATLTNQPTGELLEYRVVAMNKSGSGMGSNSVTVRL